MGETMNQRIPVIGVFDLGASGGRTSILYRDRDELHINDIHQFEHSVQFYSWEDPVTGKMFRCACWDYDRICDGMLEGLRRISANDQIKLTSFGIDTWGSDGAWMDAEGNMLSRVDAGRDERFITAQAEILDQIDAYDLFRLTGVQSYSFNVLNQVYWYAHHQPELLDRAKYYMPINSLLYYHLSGECIGEYTWMSTTGMCAVGQPAYCTDVFSQLDLEMKMLPTIVQPGTNLGKYRSDILDDSGLEPFDIIVTATHDTACAFAAAPLSDGKNAMILSAGTWFMPGVLLEEPLVSSKAYETQFSNEAGLGNTRFLKSLMGSWPLQQLRQRWQNQDKQSIEYSQLSDMAREAYPLQQVIDIDDTLFFNTNDIEKTLKDYCVKTGQLPPQDRYSCARIFYEGLALKVARTARQLKSVTDLPIAEMIMVGGGSRDPLLCQWIADASNLPVRTGPVNATSVGNALIQARTLGWIDSIEEGRRALHYEGKEDIYLPDSTLDWGPAAQVLDRNLRKQAAHGSV